MEILSLTLFTINRMTLSEQPISTKDRRISGEGGCVCITAIGNIWANGNLCFRVFELQLLKVINKNVCYLHSVWVNQIN